MDRSETMGRDGWMDGWMMYLNPELTHDPPTSSAVSVARLRGSIGRSVRPLLRYVRHRPSDRMPDARQRPTQNYDCGPINSDAQLAVYVVAS